MHALANHMHLIRGGSRGSKGSKDPPSKIILGKPEEWCSDIIMPQNALFLEFSIVSTLL